MKQIFLHGKNGAGKLALVDDEDFEKVSQFKWWFKSVGQGYAWTWLSYNPHKIGYLHRLIVEAPVGMVVDHANHDPLDNQRSNLRICTQKQNLGNRKIMKRDRCVYKGVHPMEGKHAHNRIKTVQARIAGRTIGFFHTVEDAAKAYNEEALKRWGEFACLNPV